jgi:formin 2/WAS/WASL-interacting protein
MGFLDKAKKMAEQAQAALDEAQKQFNASQQGDDRSAAEDYDEHGRPVSQAPPATASPPQGDPLGGAAAPTRTGGPVPDPDAPPASSAPPAPHGDRPPAPPLDRPGPPPAPPAGPDAPGAPEDRNHPSYAPPKLTSGDPLQG